MTNSFFNLVTGNLVTGNDVAPSGIQTQDNLIASDNSPLDAEENQLSSHEILSNHTLSDPSSKQNSNKQDQSDMPSDARRALIYLSQQGVVLASQKPKLFNTILQNQTLIRRHLSELYCSLIIDEASGVAFVARTDFIAQNQAQLTVQDNSGQNSLDDEVEQSELEGEDVSSLIQKRTLTVYDTILLLNLRKYYQERQNVGETEIIIDIEKLDNLMSPFLPLTDHGSRDKKKLSNRLDEFAKRHKLVIAKSGKGRNSQKYDSQERYEITPMIRYVVNASLLQAMLEEYMALLGESTQTVEENYQHNSPNVLAKEVTDRLVDGTKQDETLPITAQQDSLF